MAGFAPETIIEIGKFPVTNTILNTLLVDSLILAGVIAIKKHLSQVPNFFQNAIEMIVETFYNFIESVAHENTAKIFPFVMSFFIFILIGNWSGLVPGFNSFGFFEESHGKKELVPIIRNTTSDINTTFALAIISLVATHVLSIRKLGIWEYLSRYFSLNPIILFVGVLEIVSEITKIISLSFRLFGNIYAGERVLDTISSLFAFIFPLPFMFLEIIVGLVQALVFSLLTMVFMAVLMTPHHEPKHEAKEVIHT